MEGLREDARPEFSVDVAFVDRDGVINRKAAKSRYIQTWRDFSFLPGSRDAIRLLLLSGIQVVVVTNQRGVALGQVAEADLADIHSRMKAELEGPGKPITVYCCPHDRGQCSCRKPDVGLFLRAQRDLDVVDFRRTVVIATRPRTWRPLVGLVRGASSYPSTARRVVCSRSTTTRLRSGTLHVGSCEATLAGLGREGGRFTGACLSKTRS
jgi:histidinol-phosphate phosphatase family protein